MTNKMLREKSNCPVCRSNKSRFLKQKIIQDFTDTCYKNKMKTYCVKCRKNTENLNPNIFKTKTNRLMTQ